MDYLKNMSIKEYSDLPIYDKDSVEQGKTYRLFGKGHNIKTKVGYIKVILAIKDDKIDSKIHKVQIND